MLPPLPDISKRERASRKDRGAGIRTLEPKAKQSDPVAERLKRKLSPSERVLVQVMRRQGKKPDEIARALRDLPPRR
jgi:hypothetical protein